jgi:hypothetical protein
VNSCWIAITVNACWENWQRVSNFEFGQPWLAEERKR